LVRSAPLNSSTQPDRDIVSTQSRCRPGAYCPDLLALLLSIPCLAIAIAGEGKVLAAAGNNNTLEHAVTVDGMYPYLWDQKTDQWAVADQVRNVFIMTSGNSAFNRSVLQDNEWMQAPVKCAGCKKQSIGPELGIGFTLANYTALGHTMTLKSCIGNRALGWDLLPPGSKGYQYENYTYAAYGESPMKVGEAGFY
jgi:hypothetical protein